MSKIEKIYQLGRTIFSINDLRIIWEERNPDALKSSIKYFVDKGKLHRLRKGVYSLTYEYDQLELAQKLISPSYISLETALQKHGVVFQFSSAVTSIAGYTRTIKIKGQSYEYHATRDEILFNALGVIKEKNYMIASPERAICDFVYFYGLSDFDNLNNINQEELRNISSIYNKKSVKKNIETLIKKL